jgi:hypothetical protein
MSGRGRNRLSALAAGPAFFVNSAGTGFLASATALLRLVAILLLLSTPPCT